MKDLSIIIVNWNTKDLLRDCIKSIHRETKKITYDIWVVDNNSPDQSAVMIREKFPQVNLIANKDNKGFAAANNQALKIVTAKYYLLLNPDTVIKDNAIDKMMSYVTANNHKGIVTCKLLNGDGTLQKSVNSFFSLSSSLVENRFVQEFLNKTDINFRSMRSFWDHSETIEIDWAFGAVLLFSHELKNKVGILDEQFYIYAEEMDFYKRAQNSGYKSIFLHDVEIIHYGKSSSRQRREEMFIQNYKSFYLFLKKHYSVFTYITYRLRTYLYLMLWFTKYKISSFISKSEEAVTQSKVYAQTIKWHLSKESLV